MCRINHLTHGFGVWLAAAVFATASLPLTAHEGSPAKGSGGSGPSMEMHKNMMKGMKEMQGMKPSGNMDRDFAMMMRHHHMQGIRMSQHQLEHGKDPKMREMAQKILDAQKKEVAEFDEWMKSSGQTGSIK